jgi:hypothetical protein
MPGFTEADRLFIVQFIDCCSIEFGQADAKAKLKN